MSHPCHTRTRDTPSNRYTTLLPSRPPAPETPRALPTITLEHTPIPMLRCNYQHLPYLPPVSTLSIHTYPPPTYPPTIIHTVNFPIKGAPETKLDFFLVLNCTIYFGSVIKITVHTQVVPAHACRISPHPILLPQTPLSCYPYRVVPKTAQLIIKDIVMFCVLYAHKNVRVFH